MMDFSDDLNASTATPYTRESADGDLCKIDPWSAGLRATYIFMDFMATLIFNILTVLVTRSVNDFSESTKVLMTTLALSDLGVTPVALLSFICEVAGYWPFPSWLQYLHYFCLHALTSISALILLCLNLDRYILVTRPLRHEILITKKRAVIVSILICLGFATSGIVLCSLNDVSFERSTVLSRLESYDAPTAIYISLLSYFIPLFFVIVCNARLLTISFNQSRRMRLIGAAPSAEFPTDQNHRHQRVPWMVAVRGKAVFVFSVITFAFAISWLLYFIELFLILTHSGGYPVWLQFTAAWVAMSNSWWNFAIYGLMNRAFRNSVRKVISKNVRSVRQFFQSRT